MWIHSRGDAWRGGQGVHCSRYKRDTLVAGATGCPKFVLWEDMADKVTKVLQFQKSNSSNSR